MMTEIGKRTGVATILGFKLHGFAAWWLWRTYYLGNLPTLKKKLKVVGDWTSDLISKPGVAMIKRSEIEIEGSSENTPKQTSDSTLNNT
jgi:NADH:ubiquinone reductase (H+-translocating)